MKGNSKAKTPTEYLNDLKPERKRQLKALHKLIRKHAPKLKPHMNYGMIGYGPFHYTYASGREGDWFRIGLASQKNYISMYFSCTSEGKYLAEKYKKQLPKANIGKSCVRFKRIEDLDLKVIEKMIKESQKADTKM